MSTCQELVVIIRPSFKKVCGGDTVRAALFNQFLYWIAGKAKGQEKSQIQRGEVYWYGTAEEICAGLDDSWSINKVRKEIKALVEAGFVGQRRGPKKWDQTRHYFVGADQGQAIREMCEKYGICLLHLGLRLDVLHLLSVVNAFDKSVKCSCKITQNVANGDDKKGSSNHQMSEVDAPNRAAPFTKYGSTIPEDTPEVSSSKDTQKGEKESPPSVDPSLPLGQGTSNQALISHPLFDYIFLDDAISPTEIILMLTGNELEDDSRMHNAQRVKWDLEERCGYKLKHHCVYGQEKRVVEASISQEILPTNEPIIPTSHEDLSQPDQLRFWLKELKIYGSKDPVKVAADLALLAPHIHSKNDLIALHKYTKEHIYGENKTVFLGNLAGSVKGWIESLSAASKAEESALYETMNREQAEAFALSLLSVYPAPMLDIDCPYGDDTWVMCLQYGPDEWLPFASPEHYHNPSVWERKHIEEAIAYGQLLAEQRQAG